MIDWQEIAKWALPAVLGSGGLWAFLSKYKRQGSSPSQQITSQAALIDAVNHQTQTILTENTRLRRESNTDRRTLKRHVDKLAAEVRECQAKHMECESKADELAALVDKLMRESGPPASY